MASIDRLSSLPDDIICHILSFLRTKFSVTTSVLGKRWRFLWAHVPCLDFRWDDIREGGGTQALEVIHRVILRHKLNRMDTFALDRVNCNDDYQLETLITTTIDRSIRNLYLDLNFVTFPRPLFNCKTIVDLKLDNVRTPISAVNIVSLPSLKKFFVYNLICENDDALPHFLSGCPSLEELNMEFPFKDESDYVGCINISSPTIKTLKLDLGDLCFPSDIRYRIIIKASALRYLQVSGYNGLGCITIPITMISLVEGDINLQIYNSTVGKFFHSLCYVKCLMISCQKFSELVLKGVACSTVKFDNLSKLELWLHFKWSLLVNFLEIADNLQVLIVDFVKVDLCLEPEQVPKCLLSCLRTITIKCIWFFEPGFDMVRYLLRNSRVLEKMELFTSPDGYIDEETQFQGIKRISLFERGSNECQLDFQTVEWLG
ncbi:Unknown protein [Striga hermonthica]|uniref:FBD domain-containing protein n=1 Tax=Striga hermonthica TaxID=68872 RepID=A0A9N7NC88_STRHE|nr:Unknown protein [Striga hermonthica]